MRLLKLTFRQFKSFREFTFEPGGGDCAVYAENGRGKTSLADGLSFLLFDKDSLGRVPADAGFKPVKPDGTPLREGDTEVEGLFDLEPGELTLRKVYREKWTTKRGSARSVFSGNKTDHYLDGVPVDKGEYEARIAAICDEHTFRWLTDPSAFMSDKVLPWVKRRAVLLQICGGVSDDDVYASDPALAELPGILGGRKLDDHRKVCKARYKAADDERERIPDRIDEANRALPAAAQANGQAGLQTRLDALRQQRSAKETERTRITSGGQVAELQRRVAEIDAEQLVIATRVRADRQAAAQSERAKLNAVNAKVDAADREIQGHHRDAEEAGRQMLALQARLDSMRAAWAVINAREFAGTADDDVCAACGQAIPEETVDETRAAALAEFNARRATDLEANQTDGKQLSGERAGQLRAQEDHLAAIKTGVDALATLQAQVQTIQARITTLQTDPDVAEVPEYVGCAIEREQLQEQIEALRAGNADALTRVAAEIVALDGQIASAEGGLSAIRQREAGLKRIEELKVQERQLAAELEDLARQLYLMDQFELRQADLLEERVNGYFETVRWQLSERQINEGVKPCCVALVGGVPYGGGLNTAAECNAGLEIIDILGRHYGVRAPVFVDRSESVVKPRRIEAQVIRLIVSAQDQTLRVEREAHQYAQEAI